MTIEEERETGRVRASDLLTGAVEKRTDGATLTV